MMRWLFAVGLASLFCAVPALAQTPAASPAPAAGSAQSVQPNQGRPARLPALAFAEDSGISDMVLSPDGAMVALRAVQQGKVSVAVLNAETQQPIKRLLIPEKNQLEWVRWAGNGKLLFAMSAQSQFMGVDIRISRLYYFDLATGEMPFVGRDGMGADGDEVLYVDPAGGFVLLALQRSIYDYPSVWRFPLTSKPASGATEVQRARAQIWDWYADSSGTVRMGLAYSGSSMRVFYRAKAEEPLREIAKLTEANADDKIWDVARITSGSDEGLVLKPGDDGRVAVRKFNYATRTVGEVAFSVPGWDVDEVVFDDDDKLVAAFYADDRDRVVWFDPAMKALQTRLEKALPNDQVWITSRAKDDSRMLVWAGNEGDPGGYYVYSAAKRTLDPFSSVLPTLDVAQLTRPRAISYTARDGSKISGYLTLPRGRGDRNLPLIIHPHGGPYGVRDKLDFDSTVQFLANRGYAVLQPNYRGSGGYGDAFDELGRGQIGRAMQDDLDDAMDWAVKEGIADAGRVCVVGSSYGGYAALWAVTRNPERYRCAASFAGVTDWKKQLKYDAGFFSRTGARKWRTRVVGEDQSFDLDAVSPVAQIARLNRPVLLAHGEEDTNVPFKQFTMLRDAAAKAGKPLEPLIFPDEGHGFDQAENRARWFDTLDAFLNRHNPAD